MPYWEWAVLIATFFIFMLLLSRLRDALARADGRFLRVLEGLHAGIYVVDKDSDEVLYANRQLARMIGADPLSMRAARFEERFNAAYASPKTRKVVGNFDCEEVRDRQNGHWYLMQSGPIPWENDAQASLKIIMDISEQKQAQQLKRQHQEMLHNTARFAVLAEVASVLAHEINQPLMAIASYNEACKLLLSKERYDVREVVEALEKCRAQALRASRVIDQTRNFLRRRAPSPAIGNINDVVHEAMQSLELELQDAGTTVDLRLGNALPDTMFDRTLIEQVVINLLRNAVEAVKAVEPSRRCVSITTAIAGQDEIFVSIADNGSGIPAAIADNLYAPFFTTKTQGLGMGLCISRSVIEAHAGRLWHSAGADGGTTFHFTLPDEMSY